LSDWRKAETGLGKVVLAASAFDFGGASSGLSPHSGTYCGPGLKHCRFALTA
jgi:hypothetical protein